MVQFYQHQTEAFDSITSAISKNKKSIKGRVIIPTGGGKTMIEASIIDWQRKHNRKNRIHLILAPRIVLVNQLIEEYRKTSGYTAYRVIAFHSGAYEPDHEEIIWKENNTTQISDVHESLENAKKGKQHLVVFSTYHSMFKLSGIEFDTIIADESQYLVSENFGDAWKALAGRVKLCFTATEKHTASDNGRGLNNFSLFGNRLFEVSASTLIERGIIVSPRLHVMYGETKVEKDSVISEVIELSREQMKLTVGELGFSKILFAMKGTDDVKTVVDNIAKIQQEFPGYDICTITSKSKARINGMVIRREDFLEELKARKNCLIFHYDILSEGIDIPGITGVGILRNLGLAKLLQTIGRAVRLYRENGVNIKTQAWVSVSVINGDEDDKERVKNIIQCIREGGFDITAENIFETGKPRHEGDEEGVEDAYGKTKNNFADLFLVNILHEIEQSNFWNKIVSAKTDDEKIAAIFGE